MDTMLRAPRSAVLALLAFAASGAPVPAPAWGSVEDWGRLGLGDVVEAQLKRKSYGYSIQEIDIRTASGSTKVELIAVVDAIHADGHGWIVEMLGGSCRVPAGTPIKGGELVAGATVEIDADLEDDAVVARRIKILEEIADPEIDGPVTGLELSERHVEVAGFPLRLSRDTEIRGGDRVAILRFVDDEDEGRSVLSHFHGRLRLGGRVGVEVEPEREFDLDPGRAGNLTTSTWYAELQALARPSSRLELYAKGGLRNQHYLIDEEGDEVDDREWRLQQAYALWQPLSGFAIQAGRQKFKEPREWLYDETLDAIRLHGRTAHVYGELSVSRRQGVDSPKLRDWTNLIVLAGRPVADRWAIESSVIYRRHDELPDRPVWLGVRTIGRISSSLQHWVDLSLLRGPLEGSERRAWAVDAGARWRLERRTRLTVTAGYAIGSGGTEAADVYRQTGIQDNNSKFGGVKGFKYYGELLEPELANLSIATAGVGFRPTRRSSFDVVWHRYDQRVPSTKLHGANLETRPNGSDPFLGVEWDLVVAWEDLPGIDLAYVFAWFRPGDAFDADASDARFHKLLAQYRF